MSENNVSHPRQRLNNLLQSISMVTDLRWDISRQGPDHDCVWYAVCLVRGMELGKGRGYKKGEAKDEAARMAIGELSLHPAPMPTVRRRKSFP